MNEKHWNDSRIKKLTCQKECERVINLTVAASIKVACTDDAIDFHEAKKKKRITTNCKCVSVISEVFLDIIVGVSRS